MRKILFLGLLFISVLSLTSCMFFKMPENKTTTKKKDTTTIIKDEETTTRTISITTLPEVNSKLETPIVVIDNLGNVTWNEIEGAIHYEYIISTPLSTLKNTTTETGGVRLNISESITVRAISQDEELNSDYSISKTYSLISEKLDTPVVRFMKGYAVWNEIPGALGYYYTVYKQDGVTKEYSGISKPYEYVSIMPYNYITVYAISGIEEKGDIAESLKAKNTITSFMPTISIDSDGFASWEDNIQTDYYSYSIDNDPTFKVIKGNTIRVENSHSIKVQPVYYFEKEDQYFTLEGWSWSNEELSTWATRDVVKLSIPEPFIDSEKISWEKDVNAKSYNYKFVGDSTYYNTQDNYIEISRISGTSGIVIQKVGYPGFYLDSDYSEPVYTKKIDTPMVTIDFNGVASWNNIKGATSYEYIINDNDPQVTSLTSIELNLGDSISVKALSNKYLEGDYGITKTYSSTSIEPLSKTRIDAMSSSYYYNQLSSYQHGAAMKEVYQSLDLGMYEFYSSYKDVSNSEDAIFEIRYDNLGLTNDDINIVFLSYRNDHPFYYFIKGAYSYGTYFKIYCEDDSLLSNSRRLYDKSILEMLDEYVAYGNSYENTVDKIRIVHNLIIRDMEYAYDESGNPETENFAHTIMGPAMYGLGVCEAYTRLFELVMNTLNIECIFVSGIGVTFLGSEPHAWNVIKVDDSWYYLDMTWDDNMSGRDIATYYFIKSENEITYQGLKFSDQHIKDTTLKTPTVSSNPIE